MRPLLIALMLLVAPEALAGRAVWTGKTVSVRDHTAGEWRPLVQSKVAAINAILPDAAPRFVYRPMDERDCAQVKRRQHAIVVCSTASFGFEDGMPIGGNAPSVTQGDVVLWARVGLSDIAPSAERERIVCQELGHAILQMPDRGEASDVASCVWGFLPSPGPVDVAYARKSYKRVHR